MKFHWDWKDFRGNDLYTTGVQTEQSVCTCGQGGEAERRLKTLFAESLQGAQEQQCLEFALYFKKTLCSECWTHVISTGGANNPEN